ncbi:unnamed protein product [Nezara viridula]|uniref:Uncharacterized protein n=1 Tax=Nezara viridula TaxID=85310 RepID=A0A9P0HJX5_NEZVI|nr:unnamed protein product [Nezara viridula]
MDNLGGVEWENCNWLSGAKQALLVSLMSTLRLFLSGHGPSSSRQISVPSIINLEPFNQTFYDFKRAQLEKTINWVEKADRRHGKGS